MYTVETRALGSLTLIELLNPDTGELFSFLPGFGAAANQLVLRKRDQLFALFDAPATAEEVTENAWYKGAQLMPFPNRIKSGQYQFDGCSFALPINFPQENHAIHGLIYNKEFSIGRTHADTLGASVCVQYNYDGTTAGYPFPFLAEITYMLSQNGFSCMTLVKNTGVSAMPFGHGWHPYFAFRSSVDEIELTLPSVEMIDVEAMIPTKAFLPFDEFHTMQAIGEKKFDTGFRIIETGVNSETVLYDKRHDYGVVIWQEIGEQKYNYVQVFTPPERRSIAIEPMTCAADAFNNGIGLITLMPGNHFSASFGVSIC